MGSFVMQVFSFDVTVSTHDLLQIGIVAGRFPGAEANHHRVVVAGVSRNDAALVAAQMASCFGICTGLYDRI